MLEALKHQAAEKRKIEDQIVTDKEKHAREITELKGVYEQKL